MLGLHRKEVAMKKYIFAALLILIPVIALAAFQWNGAAVVTINGANVSAWNGATVAAPSCTTQAEQIAGTYESTVGFSMNDDDSTNWVWSTFTANNTSTRCKITVKMLKVGSPAGTLTACIYTNSSGVPGTQIGTCSDAVNTSTLSTSEGDITFSNVSANVTDTTQYKLVIKSSQHNDWSNYPAIGHNDSYVANDIGTCTSAGTCTATTSRQGRITLFR